MIPAILAFAVAIAYNIHIFSYFNQRMRLHGKRKQAVVETVSEIGWSVVFCGLTTVISLMSFMVIPIRPMKCVGMTSSLTVLFVLFTTLLMAPVLLSFGKDKQPKRGIDGSGGTRLSRAMERLNIFTFKHSKTIVAVFAIVCVAFGIGLWKIEPAFDIEKTMGIEVPYVKDVLTVGRSELGALYSYDLVMEFANEDDTIHFINHSKLEFDRTPNYTDAIRRTFRVVGVAIVTTSIVTSAVFACFATSVCAMCINFGVLAVIGIISALLADLFITPLLVKRFNVFGKEK